MYRTIIGAAFALSLATPALSATLTVGSNPLSGASFDTQPQLGGTVFEDEFTNVSFGIGGGTFSATVQSRVVQATDGTYDFYWRIFDTAYDGTAPAAIGSFRLADFGIPIAGLNGDYRLDALGDVNPASAFVFQGDAVNFNFANGLPAGSESYFMFLDTEAKAYARTAIFDLTNVGQTENSQIYTTFGVANAVPEPTTWALMIAGFGLTGAMLRRRSALA